MNALDIVIPARGEEGVLGACLSSVLSQAASSDLKVIVVVNGPKRGPTIAVATTFAAKFALAGATLQVLEEARPGKARALNAGDQETRGGAVAYLDADVVLLPDTLAALVQGLAIAEPRLAAPPMHVRRAKSARTRAFGRVWASLPGVAGDVLGIGCYAVNAAGRRRWRTFPDLIADDAYVRSRFRFAELHITPYGGVLISLPDGAALVSTVRRWRAGNAELRALEGAGSDPRRGLVSNLAHILRHPRLWRDMPWFALVSLLARAGRIPRGAGWLPHRWPDS